LFFPKNTVFPQFYRVFRTARQASFSRLPVSSSRSESHVFVVPTPSNTPS
jgi:hypothetical protein